MQIEQDIAKRIQHLRQAMIGSAVVAMALLALGFFEVGIVARFVDIQALYNGFFAIGASSLFILLAGIAKAKLKRLLGA